MRRTKEQIEHDMRTETKVCKMCEERLSFSKFSKHSKMPDKLTTECKECGSTRSKAWTQKNKHTAKYKATERRTRMKMNYGISEDQYRELLDTQRGCCKICNNSLEIICIDHCHTTGRVRGLLCPSCNFMLGNAKDDINILQAGITYLNIDNF